ncbi:MAG TPA: ATP-binding cassette domain-containing protein, partial [Solirubrobacterales bacterium]|nr:ATP-binding cassette domain-containing protein [Solirubrobacterales bacterium]
MGAIIGGTTPQPAAARPDARNGDHGGEETASSVEYRDVTKRYAGSEAPAIESLSLTVPAGEICVLVGPSGCGKTTAMRMANRTVEITEGEIEIGGVSVRDRDPAKLRREIGYVIQQVGLFPHRTIGHNIGTVPRLLGWPKDRIAARVSELLELVRLDPELAERY